jgi:hypothetical protein
VVGPVFFVTNMLEFLAFAVLSVVAVTPGQFWGLESGGLRPRPNGTVGQDLRPLRSLGFGATLRDEDEDEG